jgi:hypothetical protein
LRLGCKSDWGLVLRGKQEALCGGLKFGLAFPAYAAKKEERALIVSKRGLETGGIISVAAVLEYDHRKQDTLGAKLLEGWRSLKTFCILMQQEHIPELFANKKSTRRNVITWRKS